MCARVGKCHGSQRTTCELLLSFHCDWRRVWCSPFTHRSFSFWPFFWKLDFACHDFDRVPQVSEAVVVMLIFFLCLFFFLKLGVGSWSLSSGRAQHTLGKCSTTELHPSPVFLLQFEVGCHWAVCVSLDGCAAHTALSLLSARLCPSSLDYITLGLHCTV